MTSGSCRSSGQRAIRSIDSSALSEDTTVERAESINRFDSTRLYRFEWTDEIRQIIREILDQDGMLLEATAQGEAWDLKIRFAHREQLSALQEYFDEQASAFTLERLYEPEEPEQGSYNLTSEQREALLLALDSGYFAVPRETTANELAEMIGVSTSAVSERLRRAYATLVTNTLTFNQHPARQTGRQQSDQ